MFLRSSADPRAKLAINGEDRLAGRDEKSERGKTTDIKNEKNSLRLFGQLLIYRRRPRSARVEVLQSCAEGTHGDSHVKSEDALGSAQCRCWLPDYYLSLIHI